MPYRGFTTARTPSLSTHNLNGSNVRSSITSMAALKALAFVPPTAFDTKEAKAASPRVCIVGNGVDTGLLPAEGDELLNPLCELLS